MLAMCTVLRREEPFRTIFGYATLFGEDGRPMHKSWGNAIEFDEAAERMGVDVMRWMYANARPEDNILFGWHAADEARRELLVLWNVYAFFVTYARLAGWSPAGGVAAAERPSGRRSTAGSCRAPPRPRPRSRIGCATTTRCTAAQARVGRSSTTCPTWYLRLSRERMRRGATGADRDAAFATLHAALVGLARIAGADPAVPDRIDVPEPRRRRRRRSAPGQRAPDRVGRRRTWPPLRDERLEAAMAIARRAVELAARCARQAGLRMRQPLARLWLALPGGDARRPATQLLELVAGEVNVKSVELIGDESELVDRRVQAAAAEDRQAARARRSRR